MTDKTPASEALAAALRLHPVLSQLDDAARDGLRGTMDIRSFAPGESVADGEAPMPIPVRIRRRRECGGAGLELTM